MPKRMSIISALSLLLAVVFVPAPLLPQAFGKDAAAPANSTPAPTDAAAPAQEAGDAQKVILCLLHVFMLI